MRHVASPAAARRSIRRRRRTRSSTTPPRPPRPMYLARTRGTRTTRTRTLESLDRRTTRSLRDDHRGSHRDDSPPNPTSNPAPASTDAYSPTSIPASDIGARECNIATRPDGGRRSRRLNRRVTSTPRSAVEPTRTVGAVCPELLNDFKGEGPMLDPTKCVGCQVSKIDLPASRSAPTVDRESALGAIVTG